MVYVRMHVPPHLLLALVDVVAVVECHDPPLTGVLNRIRLNSQPDGRAEIIWQLLDIVHGELCVGRRRIVESSKGTFSRALAFIALFGILRRDT